MNNFVKYIGKIVSNDDQTRGKKPIKLNIKFSVKNATGVVRITDIMLQECNIASGYTINTKEMIELKNENKIKHYNILVRGAGNQIIVNNDGSASTGLDFDIISAGGTTAPILIETLHKTRKLIINETLGPNEKLSADSFKYTLNNNGEENRNYNGAFIGVPSVFGMYNIDIPNREGANMIFKIKEYDIKDNY